MKRVLVAGATGYLGRHLLKELKREGYWVRALVRTQSKNQVNHHYVDDLFIGDITKPETLTGVCDQVDIVISALGLTRPKGALTYRDVDEQGNKNLLQQALDAKVDRFVYVHIFNSRLLGRLPSVQAKGAFVTALQESGLEAQIICPTGFFSDMKAFQDMALKGPILLFDPGRHRINPIHGKDLAEFMVDHLEEPDTWLDVGGPEAFSYRQIAVQAFESLGKRPRIWSLPLWMTRSLVKLTMWLMPLRIYAPIQFLSEVTTEDMVAPAAGEERLRHFFQQNLGTLSDA